MIAKATQHAWYAKSWGGLRITRWVVPHATHPEGSRREEEKEQQGSNNPRSQPLWLREHVSRQRFLLRERGDLDGSGGALKTAEAPLGEGKTCFN